MDKLKRLIYLSLLFSTVMFIFTIGDFLALHDIYKDYISVAILEYLDITLDKELPDWTATKGEWNLVTIGYIARFVLLMVNFIVLIRCIKLFKNLKAT